MTTTTGMRATDTGSGWTHRLARPGVRVPRHRGTTAHVASLYPFHTGPGLGTRGTWLGVNVSGGGSGWFYDPFELYSTGTLTNSNILVVGEPGVGKSTAVKTFAYRQLGHYGQRRFLAIDDPKGEYGPLAAALDLPVIRLYPGGQHRINLLDPTPGDPEQGLLDRQTLMTGLLAVALRRDLDPAEEALLARAIEHLATTTLVFTLADLAHVVGEPPAELVGHPELERLTAEELRAAATPLRFVLGKLLDRTLRGMFDGATNITIDWTYGAGVVLDLSAVFANRDALPLVMMAATSWLQAAMSGLKANGRRGLLVDDEVWALLESEQTARHLQARLKLCRDRGIANILVTHRLSDLRAQADDGTAANKIAAGLIADTQTRVVFRQATDQLDDATHLLGLTTVEAATLPRLARGRALWRVGSHAAIVDHRIASHERKIVDTDAAMSA